MDVIKIQKFHVLNPSLFFSSTPITTCSQTCCPFIAPIGFSRSFTAALTMPQCRSCNRGFACLSFPSSWKHALIESSPTALEISFIHLVTSMRVDATDIIAMTSIVSSSEKVVLVIKSSDLRSPMANFGSKEASRVMFLMEKARSFNALLDSMTIFLLAFSVLLSNSVNA